MEKRDNKEFERESEWTRIKHKGRGCRVEGVTKGEGDGEVRGVV